MRDNQTIKTAIIIAVAVIIVGIFGPTIIQCLFCIGESIPISISNRFKEREILEYFGTVLSLLGTLFLGAITLWQNQRFKEENDKAQNELAESVRNLDFSNRTIASYNEQLLILHNNSQKIQLILAQKLIPFLTVHSVGDWNLESIEQPNINSFSIQYIEDKPSDYLIGGRRFKRAKEFLVDIKKNSFSGDYINLTFNLYLANDTESSILFVEFEQIRIFNNGSFSESLINNDLEATNLSTPYFNSANLGIYKFNITTHSDNRNAIQHLELKVKLITSTGIEFFEKITIRNIHDFKNSKINYETEDVL